MNYFDRIAALESEFSNFKEDTLMLVICFLLVLAFIVVVVLLLLKKIKQLKDLLFELLNVKEEQLPDGHTHYYIENKDVPFS